jgi:hypothetical protein
MDPLTIDTNTFSVDNGVTGTISYDLATKTATFTPTTNLDYSTTYTVTVTTGVKDLALNPLQTDHTWSFTTVPAPDTTPPVVDSTSPDDNETDVPVDSVISVTFSENMDAATIDSNTLHLDNGATCSVSYDAGTRTATLTPLADLNEDTTYTVTVTTGARIWQVMLFRRTQRVPSQRFRQLLGMEILAAQAVAQEGALSIRC